LRGEDRGEIVPVEAYSGYRGNERPVAFGLGENKVRVRRILERHRTPELDEFRVEAEDGRICRLAWDRSRDVWLLR
jgi:hypothetical protein